MRHAVWLVLVCMLLCHSMAWHTAGYGCGWRVCNIDVPTAPARNACVTRLPTLRLPRSWKLDVFERRFHSATLEVVLNTDSCVMKRRTSSVWSHFAQPDDKRKLQCHHCDAKLPYVGGTMVMLNHLKLRHPELVRRDGERFACAKTAVSVGSILWTTVHGRQVRCWQACGMRVCALCRRWNIQDFKWSSSS